MSRRLDDLDPRFRPMAVELLARLTEAGVHVVLIETTRTPAEHAAALAEGTTMERRSKHLDGLALDVCPFLQYEMHGPERVDWEEEDPAWQRIADIAATLGLRSHRYGHVELPG